MDITFKGKQVLVTGAGKGIGFGIAKRLSQYGAKVIALSRTEDDLKKLKQEAPGVETVCIDISDWTTTREAISKLPAIDCLVNNAGIAICAPFLEASPEDFDKIFNINVKAIVNISQVVAKQMIDRGKGGSIVNVSSQASQAALADHALYGSSKSAVDMLTKVMALELGPHNIRVNSVNPTVTMTDMARVGWSEPNKADAMRAKIPLRRFAEVHEVVDAIVYLLSDKSSMINGVTLPVDGGFLAS
ncbi:L-xylulose reductase isoform X2 [Nilaparvata lugens]|uniref:L-xylulose reductase isoform X1 n=1 Tax=Nilaparvata lugens TaxID=108931 RepID=UPI00193CC5DF|nr:L-xylulose reductase isoform X1 [Nilaparvata lugens]XP_022192334.2 L-xylulose reductase isoform X1 [Nilaparvata lugens]XP_039290626.1 L-xylulose reductase isoform X1 [Nilaparvata lugens]XP_039290627.1 L-xylulose reductase isoform X2 [Nilaparvata lugens]